MCVASIVINARFEDWTRRYQPFAPVPMPTPQEIDEFRRLLDRARQYDAEHGEPECELEEKRKRLKELAKRLGVEIEFV